MFVWSLSLYNIIEVKVSFFYAKSRTCSFIVTSLIEISQIFTFRTSDINDIITNTVGTIIGYFIVYRITDNFTKRIFSNSKMSDFYIICVSVALIMFFLQPFISSLLWEIVL